MFWFGGFSFIQENLQLVSYLRTLIFPSLGRQGDKDGGGQRSTPGEPDLFAYPWVKSSLTSMPVDYQQLKKLDAYARAVSVTNNLESLVHVLLQRAHSDLEKVRAIWIWICHHIEYDVSMATYKPADVLRSGKGICAGYALLFEDMCRIAGIGCKYLTGYVKLYPDNKEKNFKDVHHAWNAVYIDGKWHLLDCTWASGKVKNGKFTFNYSDFYFLTHPAIFINNHFPQDSRWQLLKPTLSEEEFISSRWLSPLFFSQQLVPASQRTSGIKTGYRGAKALSELEVILQSRKIKSILLIGKDVCASCTRLFEDMHSYKEFDFCGHPAILIDYHFPEDKKKLTLSEQ